MLQAYPKTIHLTHVLQDELNRVIDVTTLAFELVALVRQDILHHLEEVVAQEQAPSWLLDTLNHIKKVTEDEFHRGLLCLHVRRSDSHKKVKTWDDSTSVLD